MVVRETLTGWGGGGGGGGGSYGVVELAAADELSSLDKCNQVKNQL